LKFSPQLFQSDGHKSGSVLQVYTLYELRLGVPLAAKISNDAGRLLAVSLQGLVERRDFSDLTELPRT
jgi:hypothetical protein